MHNPEDLFLVSLSSCHMLWYLHLCADANITVVNYCDKASAKMNISEGGKGFFEEATLRPQVIILEKDKFQLAKSLHQQANEYCFIANSCNFPIHHKPIISILD